MTDATKIDRDTLIEAIGSALGDALLCSRVWEAWQHKTMTEDDFSPAAEDDDYVAEFADAVIAHLSTLPVEPEVEWEYGYLLANGKIQVEPLATYEDDASVTHRRKAGPWEVVPHE